MSEEIIPADVLAEELKHCPEWDIEGEAIVRSWEFENFADAMEFVNIVADVAEGAGHHPDFFIRYNKVKLTLSTHEIGGVTDADLVMAGRIDNVA
ncbi:4a-hydroxytetrahydrobiopterin dehydratase [Rubritalea tangerina]|uniref:Putative pterin-4-alpha-carbinolamine dehydratase n=1 Tax=Rubritalea tangerina TaxID=430798 RepID=A0ABW4ZGL7_9BACT